MKAPFKVTLLNPVINQEANGRFKSELTTVITDADGNEVVGGTLRNWDDKQETLVNIGTEILAHMNSKGHSLTVGVPKSISSEGDIKKLRQDFIGAFDHLDDIKAKAHAKK